MQLVNNLFQNLALEATPSEYQLIDFADELTLASSSKSQRLSAALMVLCEWMDEQQIRHFEHGLIDSFILKIDEKISAWVSEVKQHPEFQTLESHWLGLAFLIEQMPDDPRIQIELLNASKEELQDDFSQSLSIKESALYHHVYQSEYDTPGGEPFAAIISSFDFTPNTKDIACLKHCAQVAAMAHCPFMANVNHAFFFKSSLKDVQAIQDLGTYLQKSEYIPWHAFRETEDARFIGLCFPRFALASRSMAKSPFIYHAEKSNVWVPSSFAFALNLTKSFFNYGWCVNIRGPETGGKVTLGMLKASKDLIYYEPPVEYMISESTELTLANHGLIPFTYYKNTDMACFFSANSCHLARVYDDPKVTANHRINARLPYIFLISRIAHYLKVLQRERIGSQKTANDLSNELNQWLKTLITKMNSPSPELLSTHPLRDGFVDVKAVADAPGYYQVELYAQPHFQVEGMDVTLNLTAQLPGSTKE